MSELEKLIEEIKEYRNDMVAKNYPFQQISNIIVKWEEHIRLSKQQKEDNEQKETLGKN